MLTTTWCPAATLSLATVPPIIPLPMMPTVVMTAPTPRVPADHSDHAERAWPGALGQARCGLRSGRHLVRDHELARELVDGGELGRGGLASWRARSGGPATAAAPAQLLLEHEKRNEAALRATETTLDILRTAGFDPQHASAIARSALWTGITLVMSEPGYHPDLRADERAEMQRRSHSTSHAARSSGRSGPTSIMGTSSHAALCKVKP